MTERICCQLLYDGKKQAPSDTDDANYALLIDDSYVGIIQIRFRVVHSCTSQPLSAPLVRHFIVFAGLCNLQL